MDEYLKSLVDMLSIGCESGKNIVTRVEFDDLTLPLDTAVPLGLIVNELVTNAIKYAFSGEAADASGAGKPFGVRLSRLDGSRCSLVVFDNGAGLPQGFDISCGETLGFQLVTALCRRLGGMLTVEPGNPGLRVRLTFL